MKTPKFTPGPSKPASLEVTAYRCGTCRKATIHATREEADKCCTCDDCGTPLAITKDGPFTIHRGHRGSGKCEPCAEKNWLHHRREEFRRQTERYESAKKSLEEQEAACAKIPALAPELSAQQSSRLKLLAFEGSMFDGGSRYSAPKDKRTARTDLSLVRLGLLSTEKGVTEAGRAALAKAEGK